MAHCNLCNDTGVKLVDRIECVCDCVIRKEQAQEIKPKFSTIHYNTTKAENDILVTKNLMPSCRVNDCFSSQLVKDLAEREFTRRGNKVVNLDKYLSLLDSILYKISDDQEFTTSYLIGAPNGFGKTTFANSCIKLLEKKEKKAVPLISLMELAELKKIHCEYLMGSLDKNPVLLLTQKVIRDTCSTDIEYINKWQEYTRLDELARARFLGNLGVAPRYTWTDYVNADIVFCSLVNPVDAEVECSVLHTLLNSRGHKGLPTVIFIGCSKNAYTKNKRVNTTFWSEMEAFSVNNKSLDKFYHTSAYYAYETIRADV